jgi:hypothetical protein
VKYGKISKREGAQTANRAAQVHCPRLTSPDAVRRLGRYIKNSETLRRKLIKYIRAATRDKAAARVYEHSTI